MDASSPKPVTSFVKGFLFITLFIVSIYFILQLIKNGFAADKQMDFAIWASVFMAFVTPAAIVMIRHEVRLSRIKLIELFAETFNFVPSAPRTAAVPPAVPVQQDGMIQPAPQEAQLPQRDAKSRQNVSFEFVKGKYFADLDMPRHHQQTTANVPRFPMMIRSDWLMLVCAIPFMVIAWFGSFILFAPLIEVSRIGRDFGVGSWLWPSMLALGGADINTIRDPAQFEAQHVNVLTVAMLAFAGGYFFSLRLLLRAVAVFDLSPITFLRCFVHILLAMLLAVVIYRVFPTAESWGNAISRTGQALQTLSGAPSPPAPPPTVPPAAAPVAPVIVPQGGVAPPVVPPTPGPGAPVILPAQPTAGVTAAAAEPLRDPRGGTICQSNQPCQALGPAAGVSAIWLIIAFALGFIPDAALQFVLQRAGLSFKERYADLDPHAKLVPVTLIDGIDNFIAFRLEEANIFDVQNLATANPIMLHIESPFGIYETIDWVAQAQLCTVTGPDRFLLLKTLNIRTIFDLERAVMPHVPDPNAPAGTLPPPAPPDDVVLAIGELLVRDSERDKAMRTQLALGPSVGEGRDGARGKPSVTETQHMVAVMIDDLHVHRLRQIWKHIVGELGGANARL
jgi:hypothetical protein